MIKIVSPGRPKPKPKPDMRLQCPECGCVFTYEREDVHAEGRPFSHPYVTCPQFGCECEVDEIRNSFVHSPRKGRKW